MIITAKKVPCGLHPTAIKDVFAAAWVAAALDTGWRHPLPKHISRIKTRKGQHSAWTPGPMTKQKLVGTYIYINPRRTMREHAVDWYYALGGRAENTFTSISDTPFLKAPKKVKRAKREPITAEKLVEAKTAVEEWEQKRKDAQRALKLAKTKLKKYRLRVRALERSMQNVAPESAIGYTDRQLGAHLQARIKPEV